MSVNKDYFNSTGHVFAYGRKIRDIFLNFIFPQSKEVREIENLTAIEAVGRLPRAENSIPDSLALFDYKDKFVKTLIWQLKYRGSRKAAKILGEIAYSELLEELSDLETFGNFKSPLLIPIPLSKERLRERGFNQTEMIAEEICSFDKSASFSYEKNILIKTKDTPSQTRMTSKKQRAENLKGCFAVKNKELVEGKNIILIDDVVTTGATLGEASAALRKSGARRILCLAIAH